MPETLFVQRFRLDKGTFQALCQELQQNTSLKGTKEIPLEVKMLCALSFLATGSYQRIVGVTQHLAQSTASRCIRQVVDALNHPAIMAKWIVSEYTTRQSINKTRVPKKIWLAWCDRMHRLYPHSFSKAQ